MKDFQPTIVSVPTDHVKPYPKNSKLHSREQVLKIASQIERNGFDQPIVVEPDFTIIKGHGRHLAAQYLELSVVPVIIQNLSKEEAVAARIADNKVAEAPWDENMLKEELRFLREIDSDLQATGFDQEEYQALLTDIERPMDYSALEGQAVDGKVEQMTKGIRKALMIDFAPGDYDEAYLLAKFFRDRGAYLGGMLLNLLRNEKAGLTEPVTQEELDASA
jgi:ParB-like chromosome segregation protein Spo0J